MPRLQIDCESERVSLLHPGYSTEGGARARSVGISRNFITVQQRCTGFFFGKRLVRGALVVVCCGVCRGRHREDLGGEIDEVGWSWVWYVMKLITR